MFSWTKWGGRESFESVSLVRKAVLKPCWKCLQLYLACSSEGDEKYPDSGFIQRGENPRFSCRKIWDTREKEVPNMIKIYLF